MQMCTEREQMINVGKIIGEYRKRTQKFSVLFLKFFMNLNLFQNKKL